MPSAYSPADMLEAYLAHGQQVLPAVGSDVDTPDGQWIDAWQYTYLLLMANHGPIVASETALVVKLRENSINGAAGATDIPGSAISFTAANTVLFAQVRMSSRKRYVGVVANQTGGASGVRLMVVVFGVRPIRGAPVDLAAQPIQIGPLT